VTARPARSRAAVAAAVVMALTGACHHNAAKDPDTFLGRAQAVPHRSVKPAVDAPAYPGLKSSVIANVPDKSVGPFLSRKGGVAMGAYLGPDENGTQRRLVSLPMGFDGLPRDSRVVATTLADSTTLVLRPSGGEQASFIAAWTELTDRGESLSVTGIGVDGTPTIPPIELARSTDDIVWIEITPTPKGEICVWAEETRTSDANILAVALDPNGKPRGVPSRVARGATAWQVVGTLEGAGVALVSNVTGSQAQGGAGKPAGASGSVGSAITWVKLDGEARPVGVPLTLATSPAKVNDIDVVEVEGSRVFAWTDRSEADPNLWVAAIDGEGSLKPAHSVTTRMGGAKLAAIAGGKSGGVVAWEEARRRPRPERRLHLAKVDREGNLGAESAIVGADPSGVPELAVLSDGFGILTRARTCLEPVGPDSVWGGAPSTAAGADASPGATGAVPCREAPHVPIFVRFDLGLHAAQTEPIRIDESVEVATLAWGLSCDTTQCLVLAVGQESPVKVRAIELTEMPNRWHAPVPPLGWAAGPKVLGVDTVEGGDLFADVATAPISQTGPGDGSLVAAVTADGGDAKGAGGRGATVLLRALDASGMPHGPVKTLTKRALSIGGVSLSAAPKGEGAAVAWVAREGNNAAIHVTRVDAKGQKMNDIQLTTTSGDASNVAIVWSGGGWIVAWVDTRDGNGEVYATKVDLGLNRVAREERITNAPGDASDVTLLGKSGGGDVWLAWADPRENPHEGFADIFVTKLSAVSAKPVVPETRVLATAAHSRSPSLAWEDDTRATIAWIEEAPMSAGSENSGSYGAMIGSLDDNGHLVGDVLRTHGAGDGFPTAVAIERGPASLHVVLARAARDDLSLDAFELFKGQEPKPSLLFVLDGPPSLDLSLSLAFGAVFFNDEGVEVGDGRTRRLAVGWPH
jgi:hypothetical protein